MGVSQTLAIARVRWLTGDASATPALTDAIISDFLNEAYQLWFSANRGYPLTTSVSKSYVDATPIKSLVLGAITADGFTAYPSEVLSVHRGSQAAGSAITATPMERTTLSEILYLQNSVGATADWTTTSPTHYAVVPHDSASLNGGLSEWRIHFYPMPVLDAAETYTAAVRCRLYAVRYPLTTGDTIYRLPDDEAYMVARLAAALAAPLIPLSEMAIEALWAGVPDDVQAAAGRARLA